MRLGRILASLVLASALGGACTPAAERAQRARDAVEQALERGDRAAALAAVADFRALAADTPEAQLELAVLLVRAGNAPEAGWLLEELVRRHPARDDLRVALARVALLLANPSLAHATLAPVAANSPEHATALILRAQAELNLGRLDAALATLAEAERLYPDRPEARLVRIATLLSEHRHDEARAAIEQARATLPGDSEESTQIRRRLDLSLAQIRAQQGDPEAALATLDAMLAADPSDLLAWQALAQVRTAQRQPEAALARIDAALAREGAERELLPLAARLHQALGQEEQAEARLRSYAAGVESGAAYLPLAELLSSREDAAGTLAALDEALARFPDEAMLRRLRTEALLALERVDDARRELRRFRDTSFDDDPEIEYLEARLDLAEGDTAAAIERLTRLAPRLDVPAVHFWLGRALEQSGDGEGARRRYGMAQQRDPRWAAPPLALIALEARRGDWRRVVASARQLVMQAPQRLEGWTALVGALESVGDGATAEQVALQCLERFPDRAEPQLLLARARRAQRRWDDALSALAAAEVKGASATELAAERILTLGMAGRVPEGLALAEQALARDPGAAGLHAAHAALLFAAGAGEEGARATDRALELAPAESRPLRVRCEFRAASGRPREAREDCTRYLAARPDDAGVRFLLAVALEGSGEPAAAAAEYRRAAALDEHDARPRNNLAVVLAAQGDLDGALAVAQEAYRLDAKSPYVMDTLGELYLRKGLVERAVSLLEEAHAAAPDMADARRHLAEAYRAAGRVQDAEALDAR